MIAYHRRCDPDRHHRKRRRRTVADPEPGRQLPEWLSRLGQLLRAIGRCAHTRDPVGEAAQRSMPMGLARVRHSVLAQRPVMAKERQPHGAPMTLGNMRDLGVKRPYATVAAMKGFVDTLLTRKLRRNYRKIIHS
jgi:hypothetical protein